jgi:hypothetical protein
MGETHTYVLISSGTTRVDVQWPLIKSGIGAGAADDSAISTSEAEENSLGSCQAFWQR